MNKVVLTGYVAADPRVWKRGDELTVEITVGAPSTTGGTDFHEVRAVGDLVEQAAKLRHHDVVVVSGALTYSEVGHETPDGMTVTVTEALIAADAIERLIGG